MVFPPSTPRLWPVMKPSCFEQRKSWASSSDSVFASPVTAPRTREFASLTGDDGETELHNRARGVPLGRLGDPAEFGAACAWVQCGLIYAAIPYLRRSSQGRIICITSITVRHPLTSASIGNRRSI